jgi:hypothetical protein
MAYLVLLLSRLSSFLIMESRHHISLHLSLLQPVQYGLEHHMENLLLQSEVVQPQAFVANIDNATSGMNMSSHLPQNTTIDTKICLRLKK